MKSHLVKIFAVTMLFSVLHQDADAQRTRRTRPNSGGTTPATTQEQTNNTKAPVSLSAGIPIRIDSSGSGEGNMLPSRRNDHAYDRSEKDSLTPLDYEHLRYDDALYAERVWRELDLREKMNQTFRYKDKDDIGKSQMFVDMLLNAVNAGEVVAFADERFSQPMTTAELQATTQGSNDTNEVRGDINRPDVVTEYVVTRAAFRADDVTRIRLKEEWVFDREASRMFVRILGIAPVKVEMNQNGTERGTKVLFWVYYPELRPVLARNQVYNMKNMGINRMTWEELFESRMFSSYITKSSIDNPGNRLIRQMIKDPILQLLEGDNVKERIFNYEQDLWSY
jgi:gliding motility associated protien GldN